MKLIQRDFYLKQLKEVINTPDIKVITGIRRSGKSRLMDSFIEYIKEIDPDANIIHINFNNLAFRSLTEYQALHDYIESAYNPEVKNFVFIDEVQMCSGFERAINSLHSMEKYDIYITGSNAFLLGSDLATLFTGRTVSIEVFPFSFQEFMQYFELTDQYTAFTRYIQEGGMSGSYVYQSLGKKQEVVAEIFDTLIIQDIQKRYGIRRMVVMDKLADFLLDNISNLTSITNIVEALARQKIKVNDKTIHSYISYLCNAFAFYRVRRYDIHGKYYLTYNDKYYLSDHSFKYAKLGNKDLDYGRMIENIVAIELMRRGYEVYAGVLHKKEIDFVAINRGEKIYIQVAASIDDPETFKREVDPLLQIRDNYPKYVLTRTRQEPYQHEGIHIMDVADWLLEN